MKKLIAFISKKIIDFLICDIDKPRAAPLSDYKRLIEKLETCDGRAGANQQKITVSFLVI